MPPNLDHPDVMEDRLRSLAVRGFSITLQVRRESYGQNAGGVAFDVRLTKGDTYGGSGMSATGTGKSLDDATHAALSAAEAFLRNPEPPAAVESALSDLAAALPAIAAE